MDNMNEYESQEQQGQSPYGQPEQPPYGQPGQPPYGQPVQPPYGQPMMQPPIMQQPVIPPEYQPISMWGYFGYQLLFAIPCIGFIILCIFAFGGTSNVNLKNFARSYFCLFIIGLVIGLIFVMLAAVGGVALYDSYGRYYY